MNNSFFLNSVRVPEDSEIVEDADEEVFILYSELQKQNSSDLRGLGYVDSRQNILTVTIELKGGNIPLDISEAQFQHKPEKKRMKGKTQRLTQRVDDKSVEVSLAQDVTALRSRKGDTGSVLWRASVDFARFVLQQAHLKSPEALFDFDRLKGCHILELGAGTGVLSLLFSPLCRRYTVTDIPDLVPLIRKNVAMNFTTNSSIDLQPLDWIVLNSTSKNRRSALFPVGDPIDVLLVVDCIYHPSLLSSLLETIDYLSTPNQTTVIVVSELRSEHVIREFLELWLAISGWNIRRYPSIAYSGPYVMWIGWKEAEASTEILP